MGINTIKRTAMESLTFKKSIRETKESKIRNLTLMENSVRQL